jgi:hypothetical protein
LDQKTSWAWSAFLGTPDQGQTQLEERLVLGTNVLLDLHGELSVVQGFGSVTSWLLVVQGASAFWIIRGTGLRNPMDVSD